MKKNKLFTFGLMLLCSIGFSSAADQTVSAGSNTSAIQTAINTAGSGSTVRMEVGRYFLDTELTIPDGVTVIGGFKDGFADANRIYPGAATTIDDMTVLDGNSLVRTKPADKHRVATVQGTLDGVLVRNGHVRNGNGGGLYIDGGIVQNCIIKGNVAMQVPFNLATPTLGGGVYIESGKLINSVVAYNMSNQGYGVAGATGDVINCTVTANTYAPLPVQVKTGTFHHYKHWRNGNTLPWGDTGVYPYIDGKDHTTPDMGELDNGTGLDSEFDPGVITVSDFYLAQTEVTTSQYAVFANAIDLTLNGNSVSFAIGYLGNASSGSISNISGLIDPSPVGLNGTNATGNASVPVGTDVTVGVRYGFSADGLLFNVGSNPHGLRKVGSDYVYHKSATSGQVNLHVSNESMGHVSWYGSLAFSLWIGGTLPTEAQWKFAARRTASGTGVDACNKLQFAGSDILNDVGWYKDNNNPVDNVHEVGTKASNGIGLYDMNGNQWEWCADWINNNSNVTLGDAARVFYPNYNKGIVTPTVTTVLENNVVTDPIWNPTNGSARVSLGGSWINGVGGLSLAFRGSYTPVTVDYAFSFRPVLVP